MVEARDLSLHGQSKVDVEGAVTVAFGAVLKLLTSILRVVGRDIEDGVHLEFKRSLVIIVAAFATFQVDIVVAASEVWLLTLRCAVGSTSKQGCVLQNRGEPRSGINAPCTCVY